MSEDRLTQLEKSYQYNSTSWATTIKELVAEVLRLRAELAAIIAHDVAESRISELEAQKSALLESVEPFCALVGDSEDWDDSIRKLRRTVEECRGHSS